MLANHTTWIKPILPFVAVLLPSQSENLLHCRCTQNKSDACVSVWYMVSWKVRTLVDVGNSVETARHSDNVHCKCGG